MQTLFKTECPVSAYNNLQSQDDGYVLLGEVPQAGATVVLSWGAGDDAYQVRFEELVNYVGFVRVVVGTSELIHSAEVARDQFNRLLAAGYSVVSGK